MARRKTKAQDEAQQAANDAGQAIRDSAQKIWLAGLGAFERAKTEGPRVFENLVEQGRNMGARAMGAADETLKSMREGNYNASASIDRLEKMFEQGVSRSLKGLGLMSARDVEELSRQVRELNESVRNLMSASARAATSGARGAGSGGKSSRSRKAAGSRSAGDGTAKGRAKAGTGRKASRKRSSASSGRRKASTSPRDDD